MYPIIILLWILLIIHLLLSEAPNIDIISCIVAAILQVALQKRGNCSAEINNPPDNIEKDNNMAEETVGGELAAKGAVRQYKRSNSTDGIVIDENNLRD